MHHERFVETVAVQLPRTAILHMDHRGLTEGRQQLVGGVRGEHQWAVRRTQRAHAIAPGEKLVKRRVGIPGLIEVQHLYTVAQLLLDQFGVVAQAVVGRVGDHRVRGRAGLRGERMAGQPLPYARRGQRGGRDRPGETEAVARRDQIDRPGAADGQGVLDGLVAVAVDQGELVGIRVPDYDGVCIYSVSAFRACGLTQRSGRSLSPTSLRTTSSAMAASTPTTSPSPRP